MFSLSNLFFFLIMFLACIVSGLVGFGSNVLALPFLSLFLDIKTVVPVLILTVLFNGVPRLISHYRSIDLSVYFHMLPLAALGALCGVHLANNLHEGWMKLLLAGLMIFVAVKGLRDLHSSGKPLPRTRKNPLIFGIPFLGGIMQGAFSCGGPIFNMYILFNLHKKEAIRTTQFAIGATSASLIVLQYLMTNTYQGQTLHFVFLLIPAVLLAYVVSEHIFKRINGQQFLRLVYLVLILAGIMTGYQAYHLL